MKNIHYGSENGRHNRLAANLSSHNLFIDFNRIEAKVFRSILLKSIMMKNVADNYKQN